MRKLLMKLSPLVFFLIFSSFVPPKKITTVNFKAGSKLTYEVEYKGAKYDFIVTIKKIKPDVVFSYQMSAPANKKGTITIPAKEMDSARTLHNEFSGGDLTLSNEITVFVSRAIYAEVAMAGMNDEGTQFRPNSNEDMDSFSKGEQIMLDMKVNGKPMKLDADKFFDHVDSKQGNYHYTFTILRNENYPLITDMDLGWTIHLKQMDGVEIYTHDQGY